MSNETVGRYVEAAGARVHLHDVGEGPAVLLLHGAGAGATGLSNFSANISALAHRFRVIAPDMPGWGRSDRITASPDPVATIVGILDALGIERAALVGNSMGGMNSIRTALAHPDRVSRLITMGAPVPGANTWSAGNGPSEGLKILNAGYDDPSPATLKKLVQIMCFDQSFATDELAEIRSAAARENPEHLTDFIANQGPPQVRDYLTGDPRALARITAPTLAIHGRDDRVVSFENSLRLVTYVPRAQLLLWNQCGHWAQIEYADRFNKVVADFVGDS